MATGGGLRSLSENFETCVVGLNFVKQDLEELEI